MKTFERDPSAMIKGSGAESGQEVKTVGEPGKPARETFEYTRYAGADGNWTFGLTVLYSTTGYNEFGLGKC